MAHAAELRLRLAYACMHGIKHRHNPVTFYWHNLWWKLVDRTYPTQHDIRVFINSDEHESDVIIRGILGDEL